MTLVSATSVSLVGGFFSGATLVGVGLVLVTAAFLASGPPAAALLFGAPLIGFLVAGTVFVVVVVVRVVVLAAVDDAVGLVAVLEAVVVVLVVAGFVVVELTVERVVALVEVTGALVTLGLTSAVPFFKGGARVVPEVGLAFTGEAVLLVVGVADLTALTFLSSFGAVEANREVVVLGTGAFDTVLVGRTLGAGEAGFGAVALVVVGRVVFGAAVEEDAVTGFALGFISALGTGGFDVAEDGLDEGADTGFLVSGAVLLVVDDVIGLEAAVDLEARGALEVVDLVGLGLAAAVGLAPGLFRGAFLAPTVVVVDDVGFLDTAFEATVAPAATATAVAVTAAAALSSMIGFSGSSTGISF